jgi:hypothetical protein
MTPPDFRQCPMSRQRWVDTMRAQKNLKAAFEPFHSRSILGGFPPTFLYDSPNIIQNVPLLARCPIIHLHNAPQDRRVSSNIMVRDFTRKNLNGNKRMSLGVLMASFTWCTRTTSMTHPNEYTSLCVLIFGCIESSWRLKRSGAAHLMDAPIVEV